MDNTTHTPPGETEVTTTRKPIEAGGAPATEVATTTTTHDTKTEIVHPQSGTAAPILSGPGASEF